MRTPLFVFGVALALVAFLVMFAFGIVFVGRGTPSGQILVVVASKDVDARTPITPDLLSTASVPTSAVSPNTFLHLDDLKGMTALVKIYKGEAISKNLVAANPDVVTQQSYLPIPAGYVAITVPTNELQGVGGYIGQDDYIDIVATIDLSQFAPNKTHQVTRTVFTAVHVIEVGPQTPIARSGSTQGVVSSLTVVMTLCDAQYMNWLMTNATLRYTLISFHDYKPTAAADDSCPSTVAPQPVGPIEVNARWNFLKG
jgi:pilus assembly protein CpaB